MRKHDFYGLPRSIQDRFIESSQGAAAPAPLAALGKSEKKSLVWGLGSLLGGAAWGGFISLGFGDLQSSFALGDISHKLIHIAFGGVSAFCALKAYALSWQNSRLPYGTGDFLFPSGVVSARFGELTEYDASEVQSIQASGSSVNVQLGGASFQFPTENAEAAKKAVSGFEEGAAKWKALSSSEPLEQARLNPLTDSGVPNPLAPTQPHERPQFLNVAALGGIAAVLAVGLGLGISAWRDNASQKALYKAAVSANTVESYEAYLNRGGDKDEVATLLLPRAELERAIAEGTVEAITAFNKKHPDTKISGEVQNALREILLKELEKAKKKGTLTALEELPKKFPQHKLIAGEISAARRAVFAKAMADFQKQASTKDEALVPFVQQLLTFAEKNGPTVELRMQQVFKQDAARLDKIVSKSKKYYMGRKSLPTQYFMEDNARRREKKMLETVQARLQRAFPKDIIEFKLAPLPKAENEELGEIKVPTITLMHNEKLSGGFVGGRPKAMYMGASILVTAEAQIPGNSEQVLSYKWSTWKNPNFTILTDPKKDIPDVYEHMLTTSYDKFVGLYLARWFAEP